MNYVMKDETLYLYRNGFLFDFQGVLKGRGKMKSEVFPRKYRESDVVGANRDYAVRDYASNGLFGRRLNECHAS